MMQDKDNTNEHFLKIQAVKFPDLIQFKTAQIIFKTRNNFLPNKREREQGVQLKRETEFRIALCQNNFQKFVCFNLGG